MKNRMLSLLTIIALLLALTACGSPASSTEASISASSTEESRALAETPDETQASTQTTPEKIEDSVESSTEITAEEDRAAIEYPIAENGETLSIFMAYPGGPPCVLESWADYTLFDVAQEATGVALDWHEVAMPVVADQLALLVASGDLTDLVVGLQDISGGLVGAYDNGLIYDLGEYIEECAPDYYYYTRIENDMERDLLTDEGYELSLHVIHDALDTYDGMCLRQDWLDEQGLDAPTTYEELDQVLEVFSNTYGLTEPVFLNDNLSVQSAWLSAGYGVGNYDVVDTNAQTAFYLKDGGDEVTIALQEEGYRDYISMLRDWYEKGYISRDFMSKNYTDTDKQDLICNDRMGLFWASADQLATYYSNAVDADFSLVTLGLISKDGTMDTNHYCKNFLINANCVAVSTNCDDVELAVKWLNYWYTDDGIMLMNYGVEGESYNLVDGEIQYTELVTNNPEFPDMNINGMLMRYNCQGKICGVHLVDNKEGIYTQEQLDACDFWASCMDNAYSLPYGVTLTTDEITSVTNTFNEITTYASEVILSFVTGGRSMEEWDSFIAQLESMGLGDCVSVYQEAYDRYLART